MPTFHWIVAGLALVCGYLVYSSPSRRPLNGIKELYLSIGNKLSALRRMSLSIPDVYDSPAANTRCAMFQVRQTLYSLSDEILESIFLEDILGEKDLCALALVSRRIGRWARVSLYNQVTIRLLEKECTCFIRTLLEHPELALYVWGARLLGENRGLEDGENFRKAQRLLKLLPALRTLKVLRFNDSDQFTSIFGNPMPHIHNIFLGTNGISRYTRGMERAMLIPQIKRLWIGYSGTVGIRDDDQLEWTHQDTAFDTLAGISSVKDLTLD
jgi:hypothetical protein